jgi:glycosyltransferase involved in cell wall biosynthesis
MEIPAQEGSRSRGGVSVVICCHNSAKRIPETLRHVAAQQVSAEIEWEVLVIDNNSTDQTAEIAAALWAPVAPAPLRILSEPQLGLSFARQRGLAEATYEFVSFIDDDNWICERWVELAYHLMKSRPEVGICGGSSEAVCETPPPAWWQRHNLLLAISPPDWQGGDITDTGRSIWGAGMTVRKSVILDLQRQGFEPLLTDRKGSSLASCGDTELCLAVRMAGWRLWYEPELRLKHYMPVVRLNWRYLRRIYRGSGASSTGLYPYHFFLAHPTGAAGESAFEGTWWAQLLAAVRDLLRRPVQLARTICCNAEGIPEVLQTEIALGRFLALIKSHKAHARGMRLVRQARWRQVALAAQANAAEVSKQIKGLRGRNGPAAPGNGEVQA